MVIPHSSGFSVLQDIYTTSLSDQSLIFRRQQRARLIRDLGAAGTVLLAEMSTLLKNTDRALSLKSPKNIGVFGNDAADFMKG